MNTNEAFNMPASSIDRQSRPKYGAQEIRTGKMVFWKRLGNSLKGLNHLNACQWSKKVSSGILLKSVGAKNVGMTY